jgi:hypothetical protein
MAAAAQAKWGKQHKADGSHGAVTAASLETDNLRFSDVFTYDVPAETNTSSATPGITLALPRKVSVLYLKPPFPSGGPFWFGIHAITMPDVREGDVLVVARRGSGGPRLISSAFSTTTGGSVNYPLGNRIALDTARVTSTSTDATHYFDAWDGDVVGVTLLRLNNYDYEDANYGDRFPCWVQIG